MAYEAILSFLADAFIWCGTGSVSSDNKKKNKKKKVKKNRWCIFIKE